MARTAHPPATKDQRRKAAIAYILTWITGIIILLVADKQDRYARWHAIQAIGLGVAAWVLNVALSIFQGLLFAPWAWGFGAWGGYSPVPYFGGGPLTGLLGLAVLILVVVLAVKAYQGETVRLPVIADFADGNA